MSITVQKLISLSNSRYLISGCIFHDLIGMHLGMDGSITVKIEGSFLGGIKLLLAYYRAGP